MTNYPPGSRLPRLAQALTSLRDPYGTLVRARDRYGPVFRMSMTGFPTQVFVTTAELADQVYALDAGGGRAGEVRRQYLEPVVGPASLLSLDGDPWRRHRKLLTPPLHGRALSGYREQIAAIAAADIDTWPVGTPFALRDRTQKITLEVILRVVFGISDGERLARLRVLLPRLVSVPLFTLIAMANPKLDRPALLRRAPVFGTDRWRALCAQVDELLYAQIAERRAARDPEATDVLSLLLAAGDADGDGLADGEVRDELMTMLQAGHETTATGLAWTFERVTREPGVAARLRESLEAGDETYLDAVVKEVLRSRPVVYDVPRLVDEPFTLGGYDIPVGWLAAPSILLLHHDPDIYPDPERFLPDRFLGPDTAAANRNWMPFGGGRRYCVGAQLALMEMRVIITEILRRVALAAPDPAPEEPRVRHVTVVPSRGARIVVTARHTAGLPTSATT